MNQELLLLGGGQGLYTTEDTLPGHAEEEIAILGRFVIALFSSKAALPPTHMI